MTHETLEFAVSPNVIRHSIDRHKDWIESQLGVFMADAVILKIDQQCLTQAAIDPIIQRSNENACDATMVQRLRSRLSSVEIPSYSAPLITLHRGNVDELQTLSSSNRRKKYALDWFDLPVAVHVRGLDSPIIAMNISYHSGFQSALESTDRLLIVRRTSTQAVVTLLEDLAVSDRVPRLHTGCSLPQRISPCSWDDLVLDATIVDLLKNDFESFFDREGWFRERRLPFRRGYLLHGPPGCGKSTAIRAMMTSRSLSAYTLRLFDPNVDDSDLDDLFQCAIRNRPSMILLEDLDRAFPRTGGGRSKLSLQQLLNSLDGVASGEGVVVVATANEPTILDPAILRRPGRFDRVVHFPNPDFELRKTYFVRMRPTTSSGFLDEIAKESEGFSFAQLRETYIVAGQHAFERESEITGEDILRGIRSLRKSLIVGSQKANPAGFRSVPELR
ncbi:MAG TPA: AAA family ATPase [Acidisarcina sp.]|nr:AAA family ATPase [Acidisarcina sp.]